MHEAYEVIHLRNVDVQIESIAAYDNYFLLGTRQGHLLMFSLATGNGNNQKYEVQMLHYCKTFSKKPIQQIEVIPEDNLLLCLTDSVLSTHNINGNFPKIKTFEQTKGASLFALDNKPTTSMTGESSSVVRLCVAVRRKLQLYYGKNGEFKQHLFDFTIPDVPKVMAWGQQFLCVGFKAEYVLYDLSTGKPKELFPISSSRSLEPTIAKYSETSFLLGREQTSVFVEETKDSNIEIKQTIKWEAAPISVVWDAPFILGLLQDKVVVQTVNPHTFVQTLSELNRARLLYKCKRGLIYVASVSQVWCLSLLDVSKQIAQLVKDKQFQVAFELTVAGEAALCAIKAPVELDMPFLNKRLTTFCAGIAVNTTNGASLMGLSEGTEEDKKQRIRSIQTLHAVELFDAKKFSLSMKKFLKLNTDPADVIKLIPELDCRAENENTNKLKGKDLEEALKALIEYLVELRPKKKGIGVTETTSQDNGVQRNLQQQLELIDTTLLKCYLQTNDALVAPLLRRNNCRLEEAERTLLQHGRHSELIILYQTKGQHNKALQLLRDQSKQPDSSLEGFRETKNYLQHLGAEHLNLIFKFSDWILKEHPEEGLKIFTEEMVEVESLPRPKILDHLLREHPSLVIPYLEHVIHTWNDHNSTFHDALVNMYREKIVSKNNITEEEFQHTKCKLIAFLEKSSHYTPERVLLHFPNDSLFEERAIVLGKMGRHEQALAIYILILGDVERGISYCENVSSQPDERSQDVYVTLIRILVNPAQSAALGGPLAGAARHPRTAAPDLEAALAVLEEHADRISPIKALSVLPDSVPLSRLKHFLKSALDNQLTLKRRMQMLKGLLYAEHVQVQEMKQYHESKHVVIREYNVCPVCKKRFNNQSAFVRYPSGEIVHYSCRLDK